MMRCTSSISIFIDPFVQMAQAPDLLAQTLWEGLVGGMLYALIALGFVLIFKASGVFNFAQGIMVVFAALTLVGLHDAGLPAFVALALTIVVMFVLAWPSSARCCGRWSISPTSSCSWPPSASPISSSASANSCSAAIPR